MPARKSLRSRLGANEPWLRAVASIVVIVAAVLGAVRWLGPSWVDSRADARIDSRTVAIADQRIGDSPKLNDILTKLGAIDERLSTMEGWKEGLESRVKKIGEKQDVSIKQNEDLRARLNQQVALASLYDPGRVLATIRNEIAIAAGRAAMIPDAQMAAYKNAIRAVPPASAGYWETVYTVVNYESVVRQELGLAPDPAKTAKPCGPATTGRSNIFARGRITDCVVSLDTQIFLNVIFLNCVIRYSAGDSFILDNVRFVNCSFVFQPRPGPVNPRIQKLLLAILNSSNQQDLTVTTGG
jgi:hypothetical protein